MDDNPAMEDACGAQPPDKQDNVPHEEEESDYDETDEMLMHAKEDNSENDENDYVEYRDAEEYDEEDEDEYYDEDEDEEEGQYVDEDDEANGRPSWTSEEDEPELEFDETGVELEAQDAFELEAEEGRPPERLSPYYLHNDHVYMTHFTRLEELAKEEQDQTFRTGNITPDGFIDEDFEEELGSPSQEDVSRDPESEFRDIAKYGIVQVAGDDAFGRKVIVFSSCRLPPRDEIDHQRLLKYLKHTLDQYVENDYTLVYFHFGLNSKTKPSFKWLRQAYSDFDRKYKKNLKALYLVHPTNFIKIMWNIFRPLISAKFGRKVMYVNYLHELAQYLQLDQLIIPQRVKDYDARLVEYYKPKDYDAWLLAKNKPMPVPTSIVHAPKKTQQFGVSLKFIKENSNGEIIPLVVCECVSYLREHGLETEGIFRRSANATVLKQVQKSFNDGQPVDFAKLGDVHIPAALIKSFLRQLPEPILTYDLYDHIVHVQSMEPDEKMTEMKRLLHDELPEDNYYVLKYLMCFLTEVVEKSDCNKMTDANLAIVFGPNLMWSKSQASLTSMGYVNSCAQQLIAHYDTLFSK